MWFGASSVVSALFKHIDRQHRYTFCDIMFTNTHILTSTISQRIQFTFVYINFFLYPKIYFVPLVLCYLFAICSFLFKYIRMFVHVCSFWANAFATNRRRRKITIQTKSMPFGKCCWFQSKPKDIEIQF